MKKSNKKQKTEFLAISKLPDNIALNVVSTSNMWLYKKGLINKNIYHLSAPSALRWFLSLHNNKHEKELSKIIVDTCQSIENAAPGSSTLLFHYLTRKKFPIKNYCRLSTNSILKNIRKQVSSNSYSILENTIENISPTTHISVTKSNLVQNVIEFKKGYRSDLIIDKNFAKMIGTNNIVLNDVKTLVIEGSVSSVSEINTFLTKMHETKQNCILVCRSFPEEVISTLATNWMKRKLNIVPLTYGTSYSNINAVADLVKITGGMTINCQFGDFITTAINEIERYGKADRINIYKNNIVITTNKNVQKHKNYLINKMLNTDETLQEVFAERISNLANELCEIRISGDNWHLKEEIDWGLKYYIAGATSGYITIGDIVVPKNWHDACILYSLKLKDILKTIGGIIVYT